MKLPHKHGFKYKGRPVSTFFVNVSQSGLDGESDWENQITVPVVADRIENALNLVRDEMTPVATRPTEIAAAGPKGGVRFRWIGWESLIGAKIFQTRSKQLQFAL